MRSARVGARLRLLIVLSALASSGAMHLAAPPAHAAASRPLKVVLIGDSYSAGNGARNDAGNRSYYGPEDCYRSNDGWAGRYVRHLRDEGFNVTFVNWACSGSVSDNMLNDRRMDTSHRVAFTSDSTVTEAETLAEIDRSGACKAKDPGSGEFFRIRDLAQILPTEWTYVCERFLRPQIDALGTDTDLVLFSMGGNDIGFAEIVSECFALVLRDVDGCKSKVDNARATAADALPGRLDNVFGAIRSRIRSDSKIAYLSYPQLEKSYRLFAEEVRALQ